MEIGLSAEHLYRILTTPVPPSTATQLSNERAVARAIAANNEVIAEQLQNIVIHHDKLNIEFNDRLKKIEKQLGIDPA